MQPVAGVQRMTITDRPAEALVEQVVLRGGGEILAAAHDVGDAHEVVIAYRA